MELPDFRLDTVDAYNKIFGLPTHHPLVSVVNLREATAIPGNMRYHYGVYALFLKNDTNCTLKYGRRNYDYQEGTVTSFAPGQTIDVEMKDTDKAPDALGVLFHPDLIFGTTLGERISSFSFFDYSQTEAVHLSLEERNIFIDHSRQNHRVLEYCGIKLIDILFPELCNICAVQPYCSFGWLLHSHHQL